MANASKKFIVRRPPAGMENVPNFHFPDGVLDPAAVPPVNPIEGVPLSRVKTVVVLLHRGQTTGYTAVRLVPEKVTTGGKFGRKTAVDRSIALVPTNGPANWQMKPIFVATI